MKVISWNVRVAGHGGFKSQFRDLLEAQDLDIFILMETKVNSNQAQQVIESLNISNYVNLPKDDLGFMAFIV